MLFFKIGTVKSIEPPGCSRVSYDINVCEVMKTGETTH